MTERIAGENALDEAEMDDLLAQAARVETVPSADLIARVMADADAVADAGEPTPEPGAQSQTRSLRGGLLAAIGGWPALAGLATATVAGLWIGYASPDTLDGIASGLVASQTTYEVGDFMPTLDDLFYEG
jgi:hypothetical protein